MMWTGLHLRVCTDNMLCGGRKACAACDMQHFQDPGPAAQNGLDSRFGCMGMQPSQLGEWCMGFRFR
jgi:hypothetical protein